LVSLRYFAPDPRLNGLISSYYLFQSDEPRISDILRAELAQARFVIRGATRLVFAEGGMLDCPPAMLLGSTNRSLTFEGDGPCAVAGAGLLPAGWAALVGCSADELADTVLPFDEVAGAIVPRTLDRLQSCGCADAVPTALDGLFLTLAERARSVPLWFTRATDDWLTASPAPEVDDLVAATGVSVRQIERLAKRYYGASPKLLARKYRALQAAVRMGTGAATDWSEAAGEYFYDQSHFIREFKQFVGMTPSKFLTESAPVMRLTIAGRQALPGMPKLALYS
jgi:AraC-like DNA-binding protein